MNWPQPLLHALPSPTLPSVQSLPTILTFFVLYSYAELVLVSWPLHMLFLFL